VGEARLRTQVCKQVAAAAFRHQFIRNDQIEAGISLEYRQCLGDARRLDRRKAEPCELAGETAAARGEVVDDQHAPVVADRWPRRLFCDRSYLQAGTEAGTAAHPATHPNLASHETDQFLDDREAEPGAAIEARCRGVDLGERLKQSLEPVGGNSNAGVLDVDHKGQAAVLAEGMCNPQMYPALMGELYCVADEIHDDLPRATGVAADQERHVR
jgi:hypothetical protein